jgi:hypothetical protein
MKFAKSLFLILIFSMLMACDNPLQKNPAASEGLHSKVKMNYDQTSIEEAMKAKGIRYVAQKPVQNWQLAGVKPISYAVSSMREQPEPETSEEVSVYIFSSEQHRKNGLADFHKQTERYNMLYPRIYEKRNVLLLYWAKGDMNAPSKLGEKFTNAMNSLHIVTEFNDTTTGSKKLPYTILVGGNGFGGIAFKKGAAIESIDTHSQGRIHIIQIRGWRLPSAIGIEYRGGEVFVNYSESTSSQKENVFVRFRDDDLDPSNIKVSLNGRRQRIIGIGHGIE